MLYLSILSQLALEIVCTCSPYTTQHYQDLRNGTLHLKLLGCERCSIVWYSRVSETASILSSREKFGGIYKWVHCKNIISFTGLVTEIFSFSQTQSSRCPPTVMTSIDTEPLSEAFSSVHNTRCIESRNPVILSVIWSGHNSCHGHRFLSLLLVQPEQPPVKSWYKTMKTNAEIRCMFCAWQWRCSSSLTGMHI
jgi:hypothetical protein